ncbi:MAG: ATP-binding protein [Bacteroidota bacterium]
MADENRPAEQKPRRLAEAIFENLNEGITVADCSLPDMPLVYVNKSFEVLTGYPADEVIGRNCRFLHREERDQPGLVKVRACLQEGSSCTVVLRNFRRDGSLFYNELHLSPIYGANGEIAHYIGIQRDVTERKYAEEGLWKLNDDLVQANRTLNEVNQRLNELLYVAAHDLKSPLTSILLSLEILHQKVGKMPAGEQKRYIKQLHTVTRHMRDIIIDLLEARRVDSDAADLHLESISIAFMVRTVFRFYRDMARAKDVSLKLTASSKTPDACADRNSVLVVIDNLVSNAIKYSPRGGKVHVRVGKRDDRIRLEVGDNGPGIRVEDMPKLFGRFVKLGAEPTGGEHSTGLGLYIVKNYVGMMNGEVWAESGEEKGATFIVELPQAK